MKMINSLREQTQQLHRDIEEDNIANKIMDHSISLEDYKLLLFQNFMAYRAAEAEIEKHLPEYESNKSKRLEQDLKALGVNDLDHRLDFNCNNTAEAIGAAYVIEGSAMGGMLIGKEIKNCDSLNSIPKQFYFSGDRSSMTGWNNFLKYLRSRDFSDSEIAIASSKAQETFLLFKKAFELQLCSC